MNLKTMTKGRLLTLWAALAILAYIFASQDWYTLSMAPNGDTVKLATYDGLTAYGNLSPVLMLNLAAILAVAFVGSLGRKVTLSMIVLADLGTLSWMISRVAAQDVSGLAKQVEQMTGIAAAHGVKDLAVQTQGAPVAFLIAIGATAALALFILFTERNWPKRASRTERTTLPTKVAEPKDAIGIWDSQRR
jgi:hypothetical protein